MSAYEAALKVIKTLKRAGHLAYFAGGWVRDYLLGVPSDDIDIATSASVDQIQALFPKTIPVGIAFGIVIVVEEGHQFEVATFRKDQGYLDGRRPIGIDPADPIQDAKRRDFTINGMFYDPEKEEVIDTVGGVNDLKKGIIRAIGNPHERFLEDRLRMIRAIRYASRFNFSIHPDTMQAIIDHASNLLPSVAIERVWQEFKKMDLFPHFNQGLIELHRLKLLPTIFPDLKETPVEEIQTRVKTLPLFPEEAPLILKILELFPAETFEKKIEICENLKLSNKEMEFVTLFHQMIDLLEQERHSPEKIESYTWAQFYAHPHAGLCLKINSLKLPQEKQLPFLNAHMEKQSKLYRSINWIKNKSPPLRAEHLLACGIKPGVEMGLLLKEGERLAANQNIDDPQKLIELIKKSSFWPK